MIDKKMSSPSQRLIEKIQEDASSKASPYATAESAGPAASRGSSGGSSAARTPSQRLVEKIQEDASSRASHATAASADPAAASISSSGSGSTATRRPSQRLLAKIQADATSRFSSTRASIDSGDDTYTNPPDEMTEMSSKVETILPLSEQEAEPPTSGLIIDEEKKSKPLPLSTEQAEITTRPGAVAVDGVNSREGTATAEAANHGQFSFTAPSNNNEGTTGSITAGDQTLISALLVDDEDGSKDNGVRAEIPVYEATRVSIHEEADATKRRKYCLAGFAVLGAIVIGVVLIVVFEGGRNNSDAGVDTTTSGTILVVTGAPSTSPPTNAPTTSSPTFSPTSQPTQLEWKQLGRDVAGIARYDDMGHSLAMSDDGTIVAAGTGNGDYVRIFRLRQDPEIEQDDGYFWELMGEIRTGSESFGSSVALSANGTTIAVIDPWATDDLGGIHVFQYDESPDCFSECTDWVESHFIELGDECVEGGSVSISEDGTIVAGGDYCGNMVGVYQLGEEGVWEEIGFIEGTGMSVSISGDGSRLVGGNADYGDYGTTTVYERTSEVEYSQIGQAIEGEGENDQGFSGQSVWISRDGDRIAIGDSQNSPGNNTGIAFGDDDIDFSYGVFGSWEAGHIHVFDYDKKSGTFVQVGQDIEGREAEDQLGFPLAMSGDGNVVIGRSLTAIRAFRLEGNEWIQHGPDIPNFDGEFDDEDRSIAISRDGSIVAVGHVSERAALGAGYVRVYRLE